MAGWLSPGVPLVSPGSANGTAATAPNGTYTNPLVDCLVVVDTETSGGTSPQTVAMNLLQIASFALEFIVNTQTSTVHAATSNTSGGMVITEALTTAVAATYTFTLTNSLLIAGARAPTIVVRNGSSTAGQLAVTSVTNATGSTVIVFTNIGTAAVNGTILIGWHI